MKYWLFLLFSIVAEVTGTLSMKFASLYGGQAGHLVMYVMVTLSYIALGVAYALWEGIGVLLITLCSVAWFAEPLPLLKACGLLVLIAGIVLLNGGTEKTRARKAEKGGHHANA